MKSLNLGFIGFGLIGGSIARALKKRNMDVKVYVYSRRKNPELEVGVAEGVIDEIYYEIDQNFSKCQVIFLCAPVLKNVEFFPKLKEIMGPGTILTDVGSVKGNICQAAVEAGLGPNFIGGHPMAGSEKTGYQNSTDSLLENAYYLLTPNGENKKEDIKLMEELVSATGANCVVLDPADHDKITAAISHVPHIIAVSLVNMVAQRDNAEENMKSFAAGGFKDITRIA
ncbi:MAG: prephenate dehydrogenase/arogenate dehydrogenase family protein, partial [Eubacterium sp.]|nr:prephenate dehydrogenase/arogenate dehydrogenase family protein [Eubacterium sp.]